MAEKTHYLKMLQSHLASRTAAAFQWRSAKDLKGIGGQTFISDGKTERKNVIASWSLTVKATQVCISEHESRK